MASSNQEKNGLVIAELTKKAVKKDKNKDTFWILELSICKRLTEMYFELRGVKQPTLLSNDKPLFVFPSKNNGFFLNVEDWRKLANDRRSIERSYRALLNEKEELKEEEELSNQELLLELKKRMRNQRIIFNISANEPKVDEILAQYNPQIDTDLKDQESNFNLNLKEGKLNNYE